MRVYMVRQAGEGLNHKMVTLREFKERFKEVQEVK
jgi:hypothetical protein